MEEMPGSLALLCVIICNLALLFTIETHPARATVQAAHPSLRITLASDLIATSFESLT